MVASFEENQLLTVETCKVVTSSAEFLNRELIEKYLDKHKEITEYVILDDDSDMLPEQKGHFVKVDAKKGLTMRNIIDCENKLKYGDCKWEG